MLLGQLKQGQRFEFLDKNSGFLLFAGSHHPSKGTFKLVGYANYGCPILYNEGLTIDVVAAQPTLQRDVVIIF